MTPTKVVLCSLLLLLPTIVVSQQEAPEEIIVVGKQPGPPLWKVTNGEHVLWIFGSISPIPEDMIWESQKVATVIAQSQEYLSGPSVNASPSMRLLLNPINILRAVRLAKRLSRNTDEATLEQVLPADLYQRFAALKSQYFPDEEDIELLRPIAAAGTMVGLIQQEAGLTSNGDVMKEIRKLVKRNKKIKKTEIELEQKIEGNYRSLANRAETFMDELSAELERACFASQLERMEKDLDGMKRRANAWAAGYVDELRSIHLPAEENVCERLFLESTEAGLMLTLTQQADALWLDAAENALKTNQSTFAVLGMNDLLSDDGLFAELKTRGYEVVEP
ncbi:MAG: TraB/GumN family protein [Pseudomonadota bacterium]